MISFFEDNFFNQFLSLWNTKLNKKLWNIFRDGTITIKSKNLKKIDDDY